MYGIVAYSCQILIIIHPIASNYHYSIIFHDIPYIDGLSMLELFRPTARRSMCHQDSAAALFFAAIK